MSDNHINNVSFIGPFTDRWQVSIDGYRVPNIEAFLTPADNTINLTLDGRFGITGTPEECAKWIGFIANAMAIAAGYSCFGESSTRVVNLYGGPRPSLPVASPKLDA